MILYRFYAIALELLRWAAQQSRTQPIHNRRFISLYRPLYECNCSYFCTYTLL